MASRFWVGGTGTWDNADTTHWAATSGGAGGASVPVAGDSVTFDGSSGGGTVTVNHATLSVTTFTMSAFTGTIDFATNNNNIAITTSFSNTGSGTRTLNMGNGTWTVSGTSNCWLQTGATNLTFNCNSSTIAFTANASTMNTVTLGAFTYNIITISSNSNRGGWIFTGAATIGTFNVNAPCHLIFGSSTTYTITNALTLTGTGSDPIGLQSNTAGSQFTLALGAASTGDYCSVRDMVNTTSSFTFTNSFNMGRNTQTGGGSISAPSAGGGVVGVIGG
jgi:hypothetical protein